MIYHFQKREEIKITYSVDELLDQYNDFMFLYEKLKDEEYKDKANAIINKLKERG